MEKEYIQLPPLPADTPWDVLNVLWEFAKLDEEERMDALNVDFSLFRPLEFFVDPKNGDGRNNNPPAMRVLSLIHI